METTPTATPVPLSALPTLVIKGNVSGDGKVVDALFVALSMVGLRTLTSNQLAADDVVSF